VVGAIVDRAHHQAAQDTQPGIARRLADAVEPELAVRAFEQRHPDVPIAIGCAAV